MTFAPMAISRLRCWTGDRAVFTMTTGSSQSLASSPSLVVTPLPKNDPARTVDKLMISAWPIFRPIASARRPASASICSAGRFDGLKRNSGCTTNATPTPTSCPLNYNSHHAFITRKPSICLAQNTHISGANAA